MNNSLLITLGIISNIISVVGIVICNKYITEIDGYNFMVFLSFLHFAFTVVGTRLLLWLNVFTYQPAAMSGVLPVAIVSLLCLIRASAEAMYCREVCCLWRS